MTKLVRRNRDRSSFFCGKEESTMRIRDEEWQKEKQRKGKYEKRKTEKS